uniref:Uncharacterized protein n=1 Tax=Panagrolaimus sp. JU765 TaxID=591449 RepID=A0AC34QP76_9BILA
MFNCFPCKPWPHCAGKIVEECCSVYVQSVLLTSPVVIEANINSMDHSRNITKDGQQDVDAQMNGTSSTNQDGQWLKIMSLIWKIIRKTYWQKDTDQQQNAITHNG